MAWAFFLVYAVLTAFLAWRGGRNSGSSEGFAIGDGKMSPWVAGITLGASLASSATFVIMPGFVYNEGLAALMGFGPPFIAGIALGLLVFSKRFQSLGAQFKALTVPHWLGSRYESFGLRRLFGALNILNVAYLVLITVGCGYVMEAALGVPYRWSVIGIVLFVFGYTGFGGATAHAYTNTAQGLVMLVVSVAIALSGVELAPQAVSSLLESGLTVPDSKLFSTPWEVWVVPFFMGVALTTQPHLLAKSLYVDGAANARKTVWVALACYLVFSSVLLAGVWGRVSIEAGVPTDKFMAAYLQQAFTWEPLSALVTVAILAASMSTLDGLLVAISASVSGDLIPERASVAMNRLVLAALAGLTIWMALSPPQLVLILGQQGVYGLVAASSGPLLAGFFLPGRLNAKVAVVSAVVALALHFGLGQTVIQNPGVSAVLAMAVSVPLALLLGRVGVDQTHGADTEELAAK
ncbi:MAG: hypothetical protein VX899_10240 [Myxococcota bacterium]|nr:hypothetical protein [Myxococcota bacterium]